MENQYNNLLLPRGYLSWTQMQIWKSNKERYRREYYQGGKRLDTRFLRFGKGIGEAIEDGTIKDILPDLIVFPKIEYEIKVEVRGVPILCFLDSFDDGTLDFHEVKTGKRDKDGKPPWTLVKVYKHKQLVYYAVGVRGRHGRMPKRAYLDWIETTEEADKDDFWSQVDKKLKVTGKVQTFERDFDERELDAMEADIRQTAEEISEDYKKYISEI